MGTHFTLNCTVTYDDTVVDTPIQAVFSFNNTDPVNGTRVMTSPAVRVNASSAFQGGTVYHVLAPSDMGRQPSCSATFMAVGSEFILRVDNTPQPISLDIEGESK